MGNCQAVDTATLVIQHPSGKSDKLYWPVSAGEVMKMNPGHYVALLISTTFCPTATTSSSSSASAAGNRPSDAGGASAASSGGSVRVTRIKLLRPTDTLLLGQVYRLIPAQEVMKVMSAKKNAKTKKGQPNSVEKIMGSDIKLDNLMGKHERQRNQKTAAAASNSGTQKPRTWQPSLHSISEAAS